MIDRQAKNYSLADMEMFVELAAGKSVEWALYAIDQEPEVPGEMPDEMWEAIKGDRDAMTNAIRIAVRQTKEGIRNRLLDDRSSGDSRT